jgi:DNA-binding response OmpR family regulator
VKPSRILVVENSPDSLALMIQVLKLQGFEYDIARKASEAFEKLRSASFDLILLGLNLPDRDGLEVCSALKADAAFAAVPVIIVTDRSSAADKIAGLERGAEDYVLKPFDTGEFAARIRVVLRRRVV